jgi:hypothetical protein
VLERSCTPVYAGITHHKDILAKPGHRATPAFAAARRTGRILRFNNRSQTLFFHGVTRNLNLSIRLELRHLGPAPVVGVRAAAVKIVAASRQATQPSVNHCVSILEFNRHTVDELWSEDMQNDGDGPVRALHARTLLFVLTIVVIAILSASFLALSGANTISVIAVTGLANATVFILFKYWPF